MKIELWVQEGILSPHSQIMRLRKESPGDGGINALLKNAEPNSLCVVMGPYGSSHQDHDILGLTFCKG